MAVKNMYLILLAAILCLSEGLVDAEFEGICTLPQDPGPCKARTTRWSFNTASGQCEAFDYGGCGGNENSFESMTECMGTCVCSQPLDPGFCGRNIQAYHFNSESNKCEPFFYGGCGGNGNRFSTLKECQDQCICYLEPEEGPCYASLSRMYYDHRVDICRPFTYGGCQGNGNRFETEVDCKMTCKIKH